EAEAISRIQQNSRHYFQRPDSASNELDPTRTELAGGAASIGISKIAGERIRFNSNASFKSPGFDINDIGFLRRAGHRSIGNRRPFPNKQPNRSLPTRSININQS